MNILTQSSNEKNNVNSEDADSGLSSSHHLSDEG